MAFTHSQFSSVIEIECCPRILEAGGGACHNCIPKWRTNGCQVYVRLIQEAKKNDGECHGILGFGRRRPLYLSMTNLLKPIKTHKYWPDTRIPWISTSPQSKHEIRYCLHRIYPVLHGPWISTIDRCSRKCARRGTLANYATKLAQVDILHFYHRL